MPHLSSSARSRGSKVKMHTTVILQHSWINVMVLLSPSWNCYQFVRRKLFGKEELIVFRHIIHFLSHICACIKNQCSLLIPKKNRILWSSTIQELFKALSSLSAPRLTPSAQTEDTAQLLVKTPVQINITLISNKMNWINRAERLPFLLALNLHTYSNSHSNLLKE